MSALIRSCLVVFILACVASHCFAWSVNVTVNAYRGSSCDSAVDVGMTYTNGSICNVFQYSVGPGSFVAIYSSVYCSATGQPQGLMYERTCGHHAIDVLSSGVPTVTWGELICFTHDSKTYSVVCNSDFPPTEVTVPSPTAPAPAPLQISNPAETPETTASPLPSPDVPTTPTTDPSVAPVAVPSPVLAEPSPSSSASSLVVLAVSLITLAMTAVLVL